jgi:tetratricopeptide (TPR) repeat protein
VAMEAGNQEEALRTLDRLLILDENNEAARELKQKIAVELEAEAASPRHAAAPPAEPQAVEPPPEGEAPIELAAPVEAVPDPDELPPIPITELPDEDAGGEQDPDATVTLDGADDAELLSPGLQPSPHAKPAATGPRIERRWLGIGALVLLGAAAGLYLLMGSGGSAPAVDAQAAAAAAARARVDAALRPVDAPDPGRGNGTDAQPAADSDSPAGDWAAADTARLLDEANRAFESGDWTEAVVAYNRVVKLDPTNQQALARLREAGERYTELRQAEEQWGQVHESFANGDYREALRRSYRLPDGGDPARLERFRFNGWYNLGLRALAVGDCSQARSHFGEARQIRDDAQVLDEAVRLARACSGDLEHRQRVAALAPRGADD